MNRKRRAGIVAATGVAAAAAAAAVTGGSGQDQPVPGTPPQTFGPSQTSLTHEVRTLNDSAGTKVIQNARVQGSTLVLDLTAKNAGGRPERLWDPSVGATSRGAGSLSGADITTSTNSDGSQAHIEVVADPKLAELYEGPSAVIVVADHWAGAGLTMDGEKPGLSFVVALESDGNRLTGMRLGSASRWYPETDKSLPPEVRGTGGRPTSVEPTSTEMDFG